MPCNLKKTRLETEAIVVGYAMSRMDDRYLNARGISSWTKAFSEAAQALSVRESSIKNLRDEFDPVFPNSRKGWHKRSLRPNRQRVLDELREVSDAGLTELIARIIHRDEEPIIEAIDSLANVTPLSRNVAERLLTGRKAEDYFLDNCSEIIKTCRDDILDFRLMARGYDFGIRDCPEQAVEIKGLKGRRGQILFTDREWMEAQCREKDYWLVVVGNLATRPIPRVYRNPHSLLKVCSNCRTSIAISWRSTVSVA